MANIGPSPVLPITPVPLIHRRGDPKVANIEFNLYDSSGSFNKDTQPNIDRVVDDVLGGHGKPGYSGLAPISDKVDLDQTNHPVLWAEAIATALSRTKTWGLPKNASYNCGPPKPYKDRLTPVRPEVVRRLLPKSSAIAHKYDTKAEIQVSCTSGTHLGMRLGHYDCFGLVTSLCSGNH